MKIKYSNYSESEMLYDNIQDVESSEIEPSSKIKINNNVPKSRIIDNSEFLITILIDD